MKFSIAIIAALASSALAAPLTAERQARAKDRMLDRKTNPPQDKHNGTHHEQYSSNWAGAVLIGNGYTGVSGQFTVPTPQMPAGRLKSPVLGGGFPAHSRNRWQVQCPVLRFCLGRYRWRYLPDRYLANRYRLLYPERSSFFLRLV